MSQNDERRISEKLSIQERVERLLESENIIPERPPSLDEKGNRLDIFPAKVRGRFRVYRNWVYSILVFVFLVLPWTRFAGQQTVHLNIVERKFIFFGYTLFAHDGPYLFLILGIIVFSLAFATAWYGRIWCGWACPQTVFIDVIYRKIEELIEGNHLVRRKLQESPWTMDKILKRSFKWFLYIIISIHIAHSFFAYFVGAKELLLISFESPFDNIGLFIAIYVVSFLTLINFGWFREQFCLVACPYGRLQAALMDEKSISVFYDPIRGEPRRDKSKVAQGVKDYGDCVNCFKCVNVCPTGIDIRNGVQLECIACTACIDACDEVMDKIKKPRGLIRYTSEYEIKTGRPQSKKMSLMSKTYLFVVVGLIFALVLLLYLREDVSIKALRAVESPYQVIATPEGKKIINHFKLHVTNQSIYNLNILDLELETQGVELIAPNLKTEIKSSDNVWIHVFLKFKSDYDLLKDGKGRINWELKYDQNNKLKVKSGKFDLIAPE